MIPWFAPLLFVFALLPLLAAGTAVAQEELAQDDHTEILTDTPAYCMDLARLVNMRDTRPPEVDRLAAEGRDMCDHGEVRGGILRLRRAVRMMNIGDTSETP